MKQCYEGLVCRVSCSWLEEALQENESSLCSDATDCNNGPLGILNKFGEFYTCITWTHNFVCTFVRLFSKICFSQGSLMCSRKSAVDTGDHGAICCTFAILIFANGTGSCEIHENYALY